MPRHCSGCGGYTSWTSKCPGMTMGEFETPDVVPALRFTDRLRALVGMTIFLGVTPGPPDPPDADTRLFIPDGWEDGSTL
jgi:hypothetical protein